MSLETQMSTESLRTTYLIDRNLSRSSSRDIEHFLSCASGLRFEMRFFGEAAWSATTAEDVAYTLIPYYPDLMLCLDHFLDGEEVESRLAMYQLRDRPERLKAD